MIKLAIACATLVSSSVAMADTKAGAPTAELFFAFDSAQIANGTASTLAPLVAFSAQHPDTKIVVDGNADSTGSDVYNIGLSARRADAVQARLVAMGIPAARIYRGVYGENNVRRATDAGDRRVTIWTTDESVQTLITDSFVLGTAVLWNRPLTAAQIDGIASTTTLARR